LVELRNMRIFPVFLWVMKCNKVNNMRKVAKNALRIRHECMTFYCGLWRFLKNGDIKKRLLIKTFGLENKRIISCVIHI
jgi:hypothetical protein